MKYLLFLFVLISNFANSWETSDCVGTQEARVLALVELGKYAEEYKKEHGKIPNLMEEYDRKFYSGVPEILKPYFLTENSFSTSKKKIESIDFWCNETPKKNEVNRTETCGYIFETKKTRCQSMGMVSTFEKS